MLSVFLSNKTHLLAHNYSFKYLIKILCKKTVSSILYANYLHLYDIKCSYLKLIFKHINLTHKSDFKQLLTPRVRVVMKDNFILLKSQELGAV